MKSITINTKGDKMKRTIVITLLIACFALANSAFGNTGSLEGQCKAGTFTDETFTKQSDEFSIYEKVYLLIHCQALPEGSYTINTQWMDEEGKLRTERAHKFQVSTQQDYSAAFKFKQMRKGSLNQMASGGEFEDDQYGKWSVLTFINSDKINRSYITITD